MIKTFCKYNHNNNKKEIKKIIIINSLITNYVDSVVPERIDKTSNISLQFFLVVEPTLSVAQYFQSVLSIPIVSRPRLTPGVTHTRRRRRRRRPVRGIDRQRLNTPGVLAVGEHGIEAAVPEGTRSTDPSCERRYCYLPWPISSGRLIGSAREHLVLAGPREKAFSSQGGFGNVTSARLRSEKSSWRIV